MSSFKLGASVLVAACGVAAAAGTITNGNASFQMPLIPPFSSNNGDCAFITDTGAPDQGFKYTWYYRTQFNNTNRFMSSLDTPTESYAGDTALITYTNAGPGPAGQERFDAQFTIKITDGAAPNSARVESTCRFRSRASTPLVYNVFNLVDLDLSGGAVNSALDDSIAYATQLSTALQTEASSASVARIEAVAPTRWQVGSASALRTLLASGAGNLTNAVGPVAGQDIAAAFQWTLSLQPNEEVVLTSSFTLNTVTPPCAADLDNGSGTGVRDGAVDINDLLFFLARFEAGSAAADLDNGTGTGTTDGAVDINDLLFFLARFEAGC